METVPEEAEFGHIEALRDRGSVLSGATDRVLGLSRTVGNSKS